MYFVNIFSEFLVYSFTLLTLSFSEKKFLILIKPNLSFFIILLLMSNLQIICLNQDQENFSSIVF